MNRRFCVLFSSYLEPFAQRTPSSSLNLQKQLPFVSEQPWVSHYFGNFRDSPVLA